MKPILSNYTASITELKKSPTKLLNESGGEEIAILNHHVPCAYLVPRKLFEKMIDIVDDYYLSQRGITDSAMLSIVPLSYHQ
jgi:antitoxin StbD